MNLSQAYTYILSPPDVEGRFGFHCHIKEVKFGQVQTSCWNPPVCISRPYRIRHLNIIFIPEESFSISSFRLHLISAGFPSDEIYPC
jgi:hypothetical protein